MYFNTAPSISSAGIPHPLCYVATPHSLEAYHQVLKRHSHQLPDQGITVRSQKSPHRRKPPRQAQKQRYRLHPSQQAGSGAGRCESVLGLAGTGLGNMEDWAKGVSYDSGLAAHAGIPEFGQLFADLADSPAPCDNYDLAPPTYLHFNPIHHHQQAFDQHGGGVHPAPIHPGGGFAVPHIPPPSQHSSGSPSARQWPPFAPLVFSDDFCDGLPYDKSRLFYPFNTMRYPCAGLSHGDAGSSGGLNPVISPIASQVTSTNSVLSPHTVSPRELKMKISPSPSPDVVAMSRPLFSASLRGQHDGLPSPGHSPAMFGMDLEQYHFQALSLGGGGGHVDASNAAAQQQQQQQQQLRTHQHLSLKSEQQPAHPRTGRTLLPDRPPRPLAILRSNNVNNANSTKRSRSSTSKKQADTPKKRSSVPSASRRHPPASWSSRSSAAAATRPPSPPPPPPPPKTTPREEGPSTNADAPVPVRDAQVSKLPPRAEEKRARDQYLLSMKRSGMTYREIKTKGNFTEAESTLRGRYRTLTKSKNERVRKPEWSHCDIILLKTAVEEYANGEDPAKVKIPWKKVAVYIVENGGSYHFGNATCRKKYDEQFG